MFSARPTLLRPLMLPPLSLHIAAVESGARRVLPLPFSRREDSSSRGRRDGTSVQVAMSFTAKSADGEMGSGVAPLVTPWMTPPTATMRLLITALFYRRFEVAQSNLQFCDLLLNLTIVSTARGRFCLRCVHRRTTVDTRHESVWFVPKRCLAAFCAFGVTVGVSDCINGSHGISLSLRPITKDEDDSDVT
jgi:hypothetical protein